ncbi:helix-turn-helix domain-containing protein [Haloarchaeobius sp. TZWSO28]|uniref:helix-turn-helix domain-containing protein n=1 Tax=Haloarchaeobius sp. TZWSO28 TaxID=3446119 RepID=UPI003EBB82C1
MIKVLLVGGDVTRHISMLIAEFTIDHPVLREALRRVRDIEVVWEETYETETGLTKMLAWITSADFEGVEAAITDDSAMADFTMLAEVGDRRLYRLTFDDPGRDANLMPVLMDVGGVLQEAIGTNEGWWCRVRFPDRESLEQVYQFCGDNDISFSFDRMYEETDWGVGKGPKLTAAQREILLEALDSGYLSIPREVSLAELSGRLDISENAASERFRRAVRSLVEESVTD